MPDLKPHRTKAQKAEARRTARKDKDGAWRNHAPFCIHGLPGEWIWDATYYRTRCLQSNKWSIWKGVRYDESARCRLFDLARRFWSRA